MEIDRGLFDETVDGVVKSLVNKGLPYLKDKDLSFLRIHGSYIGSGFLKKLVEEQDKRGLLEPWDIATQGYPEEKITDYNESRSSRCGVFNPLLTWDTDAGYNETEYLRVMRRMSPEDLVQFLRRVICTYPEVNDFLVKCLYIANQERDHFDT